MCAYISHCPPPTAHITHCPDTHTARRVPTCLQVLSLRQGPRTWTRPPHPSPASTRGTTCMDYLRTRRWQTVLVVTTTRRRRSTTSTRGPQPKLHKPTLSTGPEDVGATRALQQGAHQDDDLLLQVQPPPHHYNPHPTLTHLSVTHTLPPQQTPRHPSLTRHTACGGAGASALDRDRPLPGSPGQAGRDRGTTSRPSVRKEVD